jgi:hypothetical protein
MRELSRVIEMSKRGGKNKEPEVRSQRSEVRSKQNGRWKIEDGKWKMEDGRRRIDEQQELPDSCKSGECAQKG